MAFTTFDDVYMTIFDADGEAFADELRSKMNEAYATNANMPVQEENESTPLLDSSHHLHEAQSDAHQRA